MEIVAKVIGKVEILLDQHDGHFALIRQKLDHPSDLLDDIGLDALGRFVEEQKFRPRDQRPGDGQLLLLPSREVAAPAAEKVLQDGEELENLVGHAALAAGQAVTLVNNAGAALGPSLHATGPESWRADISLNLDAAYYVFQALADQLTAQPSAVVNIASVNGMSVFGHPAYSAAKAGMIHLTRLIAVEYGRYGLRCNAIAPGTVRTRAWQARAEANPAVFEEAAAHYPLGRIVNPVDVAETVGFLASPLAAAITGTLLPVDCGLTAGIPALARTFTQSRDY